MLHAINRNKESLAIDLKDPDDLAAPRRLIGRADVLIQNFRPGVIEPGILPLLVFDGQDAREAFDKRDDTTRAPLRIDGTRASSPRGAPRVGEHSARLRAEFGL